MIRSLYTFTVRWSLDHYGSAAATVIAPNPVAALVLAGDTDAGWMLATPEVRVTGIERRFLAVCAHECATGTDRGTYECEDCPETWPMSADEHPAPTATRAGFDAYCEGLAVAGRF